MSEIAIRVEGISKQYRIGVEREKYQTMRDLIANTFSAPMRALRSNGASKSDASSFWAVKDVSFEIKRGEVVGIIGRNGAGKSTLLKILSRITEPTQGFAEIHGRVGALLEVGTGFHQELTGRENVFLNGAILGMHREEIARKFDEIVEFAEVGKFIDTPVKRYSSGMHLRLAFSVAAHLEPEILLVDEVLAVGDVAFQRKCVGKMEDVASQGRTVIFVSHNLAAVKELCQTSVVLNNGKLDFRGSVVEGLARYSQAVVSGNDDDGATRGTRWRRIMINDLFGATAMSLHNSDPVRADAWLDVRNELRSGHLFFILHDAVGDQVLHQRIELDGLGPVPLRPGDYHLRVNLPTLWLAPGVYTAHFKLVGQRMDSTPERAISERLLFDVRSDEEGISRASLAPPVDWTLRATTEDNNAASANQTAGW